VIPIGWEAYGYLANVLNGKPELNGEAPSEINILKENGYLAESSRVKNIRHPYTGYLEQFLERKLSKITLQVTQSCNLACKYCSYDFNRNKRQRSHSEKTMTWATAKKAIDFLWEHSIDSEDINVSAYGGEVLLAFSLFKQIVEYSRKRFFGKPLTFNVTSNTTLFTEEIIKYFAENDISLLVSLDGPKEINDRNRVFPDGSGTYDTVMENIRLIQRVAPDYAQKLSVNMVIDPVNDFDCMNDVRLSCRELETINIQSSMMDLSYDDEPVVFSEEYAWKNEYHLFVAAMSHFGRVPKEDVSPISNTAFMRLADDAEKLDSTAGLYTNDAPSGPCIAGKMRLFVTVDGVFIPCERVSETSSAMQIGTLDEGFDYKKIHSIINIGSLTKDECINCRCFRDCMMCAKYSDSESGKLTAEERLKHCGNAKNNASYQKRFMLFLKEAPLFYGRQIRMDGGAKS